MTTLSIDQAIADARGGGWSANLIPDAVGTALTESTLDPLANNGSHFGLFQFDDPTGQSVGYSHAQLFDPQDAFRAAYLLYQQRGWEPWAPNEPAATRAANIQKIREYVKGKNVTNTGGNPIPGADWLGNVGGDISSASGTIGNHLNPAWYVQQGAQAAVSGVEHGIQGAVGGMVAGFTGAIYELGRKVLPFVVILLAIIGVGFALIEEMKK